MRPEGLLDVIINENGDVDSAVMTRSIAASYDGRLLAAVRRWKFVPATKDGQPVKFQRTFKITLVPRSN
jgi:TonB family protein